MESQEQVKKTTENIFPVEKLSENLDLIYRDMFRKNSIPDLEKDINVAHAYIRKHSDEIKSLERNHTNLDERLSSTERKLLRYDEVIVGLKTDVGLLVKEYEQLTRAIDKNSELSEKTLSFIREHAIDELESQKRNGERIDRLGKYITIGSISILIAILSFNIVFPEYKLIEKAKDYIGIIK